VSEAGHIDVQCDEALHGTPCLATIGVERTEHDAALVLGDGVPSQQQPGSGQV